MKPIAFLLSILLTLPCTTLNNQTLCLQTLQRSAKNYWEYRVTLTLNTIPQPPELYNCRDRIITKNITKKDKSRVKFTPQDFSNFICRLYKPLN
jgi:hypothetical protein